MLGYSKDELEGMEYLTVVHPDYRELVADRAAARIRGESVPRYYEVKLFRKDGASVDVEVNGKVIEIQGETCIKHGSETCPNAKRPRRRSDKVKSDTERWWRRASTVS